MKSSKQISRLLEALSDPVNFMIVRCLVVYGAQQTGQIATLVGISDSAVSKSLNNLEAVDLVLRGKGRARHSLADPMQAERVLREVRRLSVSLRRTPLENDEAEFADDEDKLAHWPGSQMEHWSDELLRPGPERPVLWQETDEPGIVRLGPDEGVLLRESQPLVVVNTTFLGFRMLVAGVSGGDLELNSRRATRRAKLAVTELLPAYAGDHLQVSRYTGWRDATDQVYGSDKMVSKLRRYLRLPDDGELEDTESGQL